jgi:hypothetical protein
MDGSHIEGMAKDKGDTLLLAEIGDPVSGKHTLHRYHHVFPVRGDGFQEGLGIGVHIPVHFNLSLLIHNADVHLFCVQIDTNNNICAAWCIA